MDSIRDQIVIKNAFNFNHTLMIVVLTRFRLENIELLQAS
jgi:hypothetical protein